MLFDICIIYIYIYVLQPCKPLPPFPPKGYGSPRPSCLVGVGPARPCGWGGCGVELDGPNPFGGGRGGHAAGGRDHII